MNWDELEIFKGIDLTDSFVMNWNHEGGQVIFELEASVWPESEYYQEPKKSEYTCYRKAILKFTEIKSCSGLVSTDTVKPTKDPDGSIDYGVIETLSKTDLGFKVSGDFGSVDITGGNISFEIFT